MKKLEKIYPNVYLFIMLFIYPLIMTNMYFNVSLTKRITFFVAAAVLVLGGILTDRFKLAVEDNYLMYLIFILLVVNLVMTDDIEDSLSGKSTYGMGIILSIVLVFVIIALKRAHISEIFFLYVAVGTLCFEVIFGLCQFCGLDLFGMLQAIKLDTVENFLGTMGNTSIFGFYVIIILPFAFYAMTKSEDMGVLGTIAVGLGGIGTVISNTDSTILGFCVVLIVVFFIFGKTRESLYTFFKGITAIGIGWIFLKILFSILKTERNVSFLGGLMINPIVSILFTAVGVACSIYLKRHPQNYRFDIKIATKVVTGIIIATILLFVCAAIIYTNLYDTRSDSRLAGFLYLDNLWGNGRGYIWTKSLQLYWKGNVVEKLLGRGAGSFYRIFIPTYGNEMLPLMGEVYNDAHNTYIECLFEYGAVGLTLVFALFANAFRLAFYASKLKAVSRSGSENDIDNVFRRMFAVALLAAFVMNFLLVIQCITPAFMALLIGLCYNEHNFTEEANS